MIAMRHVDPTWLRNQNITSLLALGGDSRSCVDPATGLNKYGCANRPLPQVVEFGSCTASTISANGFMAAERLLRRLQALDLNEHLALALDEAFQNVRAEVLFLSTRQQVPGTELVLMPSGTDAEYLCLLLAMGWPDPRPVCNIVTGPLELGSGSELAAGGMFFDPLLPSGESSPESSAIDSEVAAAVNVCTVNVRHPDGRPRSPAEVDAEVLELAEQFIATGHHVLVHVVAHNKTGLHAPSLTHVDQMAERFGDRLSVVVDAAQGRFSRRGMIETLRKGYLAIVTGSKFFGGPAFAGGVLIPPRMHPEARGLTRLPQGCAHFMTRAQLPDDWSQLRSSLPASSTPGLLMRWEAAVAEMREYYATPSQLRLEILRAFERMVPELFQSEWLVLDPIEPIIDEDFDRLLESKTTVFPFAIRCFPSDTLGRTKAELAHVYRWLNDDCSNLGTGLVAHERRDLARKFHIGQPVALAEDTENGPAILRVALGGVQITRVAQDQSLGGTFASRLHWLEDQLIALRRKLEVIAANFDTLLAADRQIERGDAA